LVLFKPHLLEKDYNKSLNKLLRRQEGRITQITKYSIVDKKNEDDSTVKTLQHNQIHVIA